MVFLFFTIINFFNFYHRFHPQVDNMESVLLSAKLQDCYNATVAGGDDLRVYCPVIGQAYVARYDDKLWYRAQVIGEDVCICMSQFSLNTFLFYRWLLQMLT